MLFLLEIVVEIEWMSYHTYREVCKAEVIKVLPEWNATRRSILVLANTSLCRSDSGLSLFKTFADVVWYAESEYEHKIRRKGVILLRTYAKFLIVPACTLQQKNSAGAAGPRAQSHRSNLALVEESLGIPVVPHK